MVTFNIKKTNSNSIISTMQWDKARLIDWLRSLASDLEEDQCSFKSAAIILDWGQPMIYEIKENLADSLAPTEPYDGIGSACERDGYGAHGL